jgi:eukaryotic-like serine/threonine-protein kinase
MGPPALLLGNRYQLDVCIGVGGMGEVWRATDLVLGRVVAVKLLRSAGAGSEEDRARFRAEARHAGSLSHPGIARVYDYREEDPPVPPYLVMELVDGPSLAALLDEGPIDAARTMGLIAQAAAALQAAHATGLVHRDIKPGNLLVTEGGDVKITDFGIARAAGSASVTSPGTLIGTPAYLAPERAAGSPATPASDLYALGIVAYQCLTGRLPFNGEPLAMALAHLERPVPPLPPGVPAGVAALVADLTAKNPRARPASAGEVANRAERLRHAVTGAAAGPFGRRALTQAARGTTEAGGGTTEAGGGTTEAGGGTTEAGGGTDTKTMVAPLPSWGGTAVTGAVRGAVGGAVGGTVTRRRGKPYGRVLVGVALAVTAAVAGAGWVIAGRSAPQSVLPAATQVPGPGAGGHRTHPVGRASGNGTTGADVVGRVGKSAASDGRHGSHSAATASPGHGSKRKQPPSVTRSPGGALSPSGAPPPGGTPSPGGTPTPGGTPSPTATPTLAGTPTPTQTATGAPAQTGTPSQAGTPAPTGTSTAVLSAP